MTDLSSEFMTLFQELSHDQQTDILALMKTWSHQNRKQSESHIKTSDAFIPLSKSPSFSKDWHCLSALKEVVQKHFMPRTELAYIAFHPDLDSVSTAKSRAAVEQMYVLEAAYELKRILETNPESDVLDENILTTFHQALARRKIETEEAL